VKILVVGGGGREHALAYAFAKTSTVYCLPGNPGSATVATNLPGSPSNASIVIDAVRAHHIDLVVVGPEAPLAAGLADALNAADIRVFGPSARAARIESSKAYAKDLMRRAGVPTATSRTFTGLADARVYIETHAEPLVVKASGLAAGKGAIVCETRAAALAAASEMFGGRFGDAGSEVIVEAFLEGEELSVLAITDGERVMLLPPAQDHKRLGEGDRGPNTGGMGAYTPVSIATPYLLDAVVTKVIDPVLRQMMTEGDRFRGVLYAGLMCGADGEPAVVEFNCRFGDPEAQVVLPAVRADLAEHCWRVAAGEPWSPRERLPAERAVVTTVIAAGGYPEAPHQGAVITIPDHLPEATLLFHAGTSRDAGGTLRAAGGRVLCATGLGDTVAEAAMRSRQLAAAVSFEGAQYRRDIAWREVARAGAS